jgi:hypothetical protein
MFDRVPAGTALGLVAVGALLGVALAAVAGSAFPPAPEAAGDASLSGETVWVSGELAGVSDDTITLRTANGTLEPGTGHGVTFVRRDGARTSTRWTGLDPGKQVCAAVHVHPDGRVHVVKAFYDATCTPTPAADG